MFQRGLNRARFVALIQEFRQKLTRERIEARLREVSQDELIALVKLEAEMKARYLVAVLELIDPKLTDLESKLEQARRSRELAEEVERGLKSIIDGVTTNEIPMSGLKVEAEFSPDIERAIEDFIAQNDHYD